MSKSRNKYEVIKSEKELMTFLNSIGVLNYLNRRKSLVLLENPGDIKLSLNVDGGSYTDHKKIVVGIPTELLMGLTKQRVILLLEGLTIHECYHNLRTSQEVWDGFIKKTGKYFAKEFNVPTVFGESIAQKLLNCVEDGRIERIASRENGYHSKCLAITNASFFDISKAQITRKGTPEEELARTIDNFVFYAKLGIPVVGYSKFYKNNMKYMKKAKPHIFKFVEEDSLKEAVPHLENAINECYDLFKDLFSKIDFNKATPKNQDQIGEGCGSKDGSPSGSSSSSSSSSNDSDESNESNKDESNKSNGSSNSSKEEKTKDNKDDKNSGSNGDKSNKKDDDKNDGKGSGNGKDSKKDKEDKNEEVNGSGSNSKDDKKDNKDGNGSSKDDKKSKEENGNNSSNNDKNGKDDKNGNTKSSDDKSNDSKESDGNSKDESKSGNGDTNSTLKEMLDKHNAIMNEEKINVAELTEELEDIVNSILNTIEETTNLSIDRINDDNEIEEAKIKEEKNEVDKGDILAIQEDIKLGSGRWFDFKLKYLYHQNKSLMSVPSDIEREAYRIREHFKKLLIPQKNSVKKNRRRGQVDRSGLWKYAVNDDKMFQRSNRPHNNDYAIYIMVDGSGSMGSDKFKKAFLSTALLEEVLYGLVSLKIIMFSDSGGVIEHDIVKNFSDNQKGSYSHTYYNHNRSKGANADGISIRIATKELMKRKERDKMLIILSDGQPNGGFGYSGQTALNDVRNAVDSAREQRIKVFNIMFGDDYERAQLASTFRYMYQKGIVSCDPRDIGEELMRILRNEIK